MTRLLYIFSVCVVSAACTILGLSLNGRNRLDPKVEAILHGPGVVERFGRDGGQGSRVGDQTVSPLVAQAQEFGRYLNPPPAGPEATVKPPVALAVSTPPEAKPGSRPIFSTAGFKLVATSYYEGRPDRSMALLSEPGNGDTGRWVREGTQVGHFTVHEIRQGVVVLRDGDNIRELAVARTAIQRNLVKEIRPAASQAKALVTDSNE